MRPAVLSEDRCRRYSLTKHAGLENEQPCDEVSCEEPAKPSGLLSESVSEGAENDGETDNDEPKRTCVWLQGGSCVTHVVEEV
jgi:hypothetical protein